MDHTAKNHGMDNRSDGGPRVVVIGAGFAGIAAARALRDGGISDVIVLEAQDRAGGRLKTVQLDDGYIELGAQFIHGETGNGLYELADKYGMLKDKSTYQAGRTSDSTAEDYKYQQFFMSDGRLVDNDIISRSLPVLNHVIHDSANAFYERNDYEALKDMSFTDFLAKAYKEFLQKVDGPEDIKDAIFSWMETWQYVDRATRMEDSSLVAYGKYKYAPGFGLTLTTSGLNSIFNAFLHDSVPDSSLILNKPVKTIQWRNSVSTSRLKSVQVLCEDGQAIDADHVIVTSPIGYLKVHEANMFDPPLPDIHRKAIHSMGFGCVAKVFLIWDDLDHVIGPNVEGIQMLWMKGFSPKLPSSRTSARTSRGKNWYDNLQGFERIASHKGAFLTWVAGEEAKIMESLPEDEVKDVLYELLVVFTGKSDMPRPKKMMRSMWHSNPYCLGAYSYLAANQDMRLHDVLRKPVPSLENPVVQLAGEACSQFYFSTVHGAIESGRMAARNIIHHYGNTSTAMRKPKSLL